MKMKNRCLFCSKEIDDKSDFHQSCSVSFFGVKNAPTLDYTLEEMAELAKNVVESSVAVTGVQPKLSLGFIEDTINEKNNGRLTILGALGGNYILKPQNITYPQMPENEYLTMKMAQLCGISVVPFSLIRLKSGELSYITKRVDRTIDGQKIHMLDMFQILEAFDKYKSSVERVGKAVWKYSENTILDMLRLFEVVIFSYITGNNDMHLKNFSLILNDNNWTLSPFYDLLNVNLHLPEDKEEMALTLNAKKRKLTLSDFKELGLNFNLNEKQIKNTFNRFVKLELELKKEIDDSFLSEENKEKYKNLLEHRLSLFKI